MADNDLFYLTDPVRGKIPDINTVIDGSFTKISPTRAQFLRFYADASKYMQVILAGEINGK